LRKNGAVVRLQPQPFKVLAFLVSHAGQTVTRSEIQQAVWDGGTFVDFEHGLNFCIKQIRNALGDDAQSPRMVETLPRRGYRFIAPVETANGSPAVEMSGPPAVERAPARSPARLSLVLAVIAASLLVAGYLIWRNVWRNTNRIGAPAGKIMLAVLPFENLSGDSEQDYFSDGMTEEMIATLGRLQPESLGVIARTSSMTYKGTNKDISRIGRELGVGFVVEGSVRREQDRLRITAQLIQVSDQTHLWSESYDRATGGVLNIQSDVAEQIARALSLRLLGESRGSAQQRDPEVLDSYLRGRYLWNKGDRDSVKRSLEYFNGAVDRDQNYAAAFAGLADSYRLLGMYYVMLPSEAYPKAKISVQRALELDSSDAGALVSLATIKFRYEWKWAEAEQDLRRAIEINPSLAIAHHDYAWFLVAMERYDEGIEQIKIAQRLDPLSPLANSDVGWVYLMARRYDEAIEQINRTLELEPRFGSAVGCLERAYELKGQPAKALEILLKETNESGISQPDGDAAVLMKSLYREKLQKQLASMKEHRSSPYNLATTCMAAGGRGQALEWLEAAFNDRDPMLVMVKSDPMFDELRSDVRFRSLLKRIGFPE